MAVIKLMDEILSNKIAAGEVVEKCSSVVKELVENSIDASSTEIRVELKESGVKEIKVTDNGSGMVHDDAIMCFNRHATSKILDEDDLYHIHTLGFRGEALASIASVSEVELITSTGDVGTTVIIKGGKVLDVKNSDSAKGTTICVKNLFYNTPARLKHLKSLYAELYNIMDYMNKIALSHPEIRFSVYNDNKELLKTDGSNNLLKAIKNVYGLNTARKMIQVQGTNDDYSIDGYISLPEIHRSTRNNMVTIVNGRIVKNYELNRTINDAYHSYKPDNYYPIVVLNIEVDTTLIDVNIHPTKMDIKFGKMESLTSLVHAIIRGSISKKTLIPHIEVKKEEPKKEVERFTLSFDTVMEDTEEYIINEDISGDINEVQIHEDVKEKLPIIYPVGLVHGTYIVCQNELGMYLIDQHAAKERINYEKVLKLLNLNEKMQIMMLVPLTIEYTSSEFIKLKENFEYLRSINFDIDEFGVNSVIVKAHPKWIPEGNESNAVKKVLELVIEREHDFDPYKFNDLIAATMACKMSIKANTNITQEEMENLINDLRECDNPFNCPHGRPTLVYYSTYDLEKMFKRTGF